VVKKIPLNKAAVVGKELEYIIEAINSGNVSGPGPNISKCEKLLEQSLAGGRVLMTASCGTALDMAARACDLGEGDEVILPSFTHPATANAFLTAGARPVFVDIRRDTCNIDESLIERAITRRTKVIVVVHYAGVACEMDEINRIAQEHGITVVEDAAHALGATYRERALGSLGHLGAFSFHGTKNLSCGEGGALVVNWPDKVHQLEMIRDSGMDRLRFMRGEAREYRWKTIGLSGLMSEMSAAFLLGQLEQVSRITQCRRAAFDKYNSGLRPLESAGVISLPAAPTHCEHNGHIFYATVLDDTRNQLLEYLNRQGVGAAFHYLPLHVSECGQSYGYRPGQLPVTESVSRRIFRLPLFYGISAEQQTYVVDKVFAFFGVSRG
jgi:dTDP-4-amino-4,6-dideoxygalactose transaminase